MAMRAKAAMIPAMETISPALKVLTMRALGGAVVEAAEEMRRTVRNEDVISQCVERDGDWVAVARPVQQQTSLSQLVPAIV